MITAKEALRITNDTKHKRNERIDYELAIIYKGIKSAARNGNTKLSTLIERQFVDDITKILDEFGYHISNVNDIGYRKGIQISWEQKGENKNV